MTSTTASTVRPVIPFTRVVLVVAALLAIIAGIQLYILTDNTAHYFAWTIAAPLSTAFVGAGYWTGAVLLLLAARERAWADIRIAMAAVTMFVPLMCITTLLHLDRFHLGSPDLNAQVAAWAWMIVYLAVPFLVAAIYFLQLRTPGGDSPPQGRLDPVIRVLLAGNAAIAAVVGVVLFLVPEALFPLWPWPLTPLTARATGSGFLALAAGSLQFVRENAWSRGRVGTIPYMLVGLLQLLALARYAGTVDWSRPVSWLYVLFMLGVLGGGLYAAIVAWGLFPQRATEVRPGQAG